MVSTVVPASVEAIIAGREITEPRVRPGGAWVSYVVRPAGGPAAVVAVPIAGDPLRILGPETQLTTWPPPLAGRGAGGGCHCWTPDGTAIVYVADDGCLWRQSMTLAAPERLTLPGTQARAPAAVALGDGTVFVAHMVDEAAIQLTVCTAGGVVDSFSLDDGGDDFCFDPDIRVVVAAAPTDDGAVDIEVCWLAWSAPAMPWDSAVVRSAHVAVRIAGDEITLGSIERSTPAGDTARDGTRQQPRWSAVDGSLFTITDDHGWLNLCRGERVMDDPGHEHALPTWGPGQRSYAVEPTSGRVAVARARHGFAELVLVEPGAAVIEPGAAVIEPGSTAQLDWRDGRLVALHSDTALVPRVVVYDTTATESRATAAPERDGAATVVWPRLVIARSAPIGWDSLELDPPESVTADNDGTTVHARLYRGGRTTARLVCLVHGGPTDQWQVSFLPRVAFWATRGWDVLVVDPRGSTGHGRVHQQALHGGWGVDDVADIATMITAIQERSECTAERTIAIGASSGGLGVLGLLAYHRDLVAGGIAVCPVSDLIAVSAGGSRFEAHYTDTLVGPLRTEADRARYRKRSPVDYAARIGGPLLLIHGTHDPVVPVEQSRRLAAAIEAAGGSVEYHEFAGEGHTIREPANRRREFSLMEEFAERIASSPWDM